MGAANAKIGFLKGSRRLPFKKLIFIMGIAALELQLSLWHGKAYYNT